MTIEQRIALVQAGYTKGEIAAMEQPELPELTVPISTTPVTIPAAENMGIQPELQVASVTQPQQPAAAESATPTTQDVLLAIQQLTKTIQANAIANSQQPKLQTTDDIIAQIINPPTLRKE